VAGSGLYTNQDWILAAGGLGLTLLGGSPPLGGWAYVSKISSDYQPKSWGPTGPAPLVHSLRKIYILGLEVFSGRPSIGGRPAVCAPGPNPVESECVCCGIGIKKKISRKVLPEGGGY